MSDDHSSPQSKSSSNPITRGLKRWLSTAPETRDELVKILHDSRQLLEPDTVDMLEGVLDLPATKIHEIMTPISQVVAIYDEFPPHIYGGAGVPWIELCRKLSDPAFITSR